MLEHVAFCFTGSLVLNTQHACFTWHLPPCHNLPAKAPGNTAARMQLLYILNFSAVTVPAKLSALLEKEWFNYGK